MILPSRIKSWVWTGHGDANGPLGNLVELRERPLPELRKGQVLIRVDGAPINPSDEMFIRGLYGTQPKPGMVPGLEGCGTVVAANAGAYGWWLKGRRVCFGGLEGDGSWSEFSAVDAFSCIPISKQLSVPEAASLIVNPMSAIGLLDRVRRERASAFVVNAAGSALGRHLLALTKSLVANISAWFAAMKPQPNSGLQVPSMFL